MKGCRAERRLSPRGAELGRWALGRGRLLLLIAAFCPLTPYHRIPRFLGNKHETPCIPPHYQILPPGLGVEGWLRGKDASP